MDGNNCCCEVIGPVRDNGDNEKYRDVKLLTPIPIKSKGIIKFKPFSQVSIVTGKSFYWARTIKVPYLNIEESITLINELNNILK